MSILSFDISTFTGDPATARITLSDEVGGGDIEVTVEVVNGTIADLRGLFFNIDESFVDGLSVVGDDVTDSQFAVNNVSNLGGGVNMNGTQTDFDGGVEIGTSGIGRDDISSTTFILSHDTDDLTLDLFENQDFGVRLTSVGANRNGSSKLVGNVGDINFPPDAVDDATSTNEDTPVSGNVLDGSDGGLDTDPDSDPLTVTGNTDPSNGSVTVNPDGSYTYTPDTDFSGTDSFTYDISDGNGGTDTATVTITVNDVNDPPIAEDDGSFFVEFGDMALVDVVANDTDLDGTVDPSTLAFFGVDLGTAVEDGGQLKYTANTISYDTTDSSANDDLTYTVNDNAGATSNPAAVTAQVIDPLRETDQDSSETSNGQLITLELATEDRTFNDSSFAEVDITFGSLTPSDINISFVVDESGSISNSQYTEQLAAVQNTINQLRNDFTGSGTNIEVQIVGFSTTASQQTYDLFESDLDDVTTGTPIASKENSLTNYEAGFQLAETFFTTGQGTTDENFLVFLTDGQPNRPSSSPNEYADELTGLNNANVDIIAIGFGSGINTTILDPIDNTGAGADVVASAADLGDVLGASPLFPADLLDFSLTVNGNEVANETDLTQLPGGDYDLDTTLTGLDNNLGATNTVVATAIFDVNKNGIFDNGIDATRTVTTIIDGTDGSNITFQ